MQDTTAYDRHRGLRGLLLPLTAVILTLSLAARGGSAQRLGGAEIELWPPSASSPEAVFETIQAAIDSLPADPAGYTVQIGGGVHHEAVRIREVHGKPGRPVTITRIARDPVEAVIDGAIPDLEAHWEIADPELFGPNVYLTRKVTGSRRVVTASYRGGPKDGLRLWTYGLARPVSGSAPPIDPLLAFKERANPLLHPPVPPHGICYDSEGILYAALPPGEDPRTSAPLSVSRADFVLSIEGSSHIHVKDLHVRNGGEATILVRDGSFSNLIENVTVRGGHRGIFFKLSEPSNGNVVRGCRLVETYDPSWYWTDFKDEVHRLHDDASLESFTEFELPKMMEGTGIAFSVGEDNVVEDCDVEGYFDGIGQTSVQSKTRRLRIRRNTVHGIPDGAIQIHGEASAAEVHHNLVFDVHTAISMAPTMAPPIDGDDSPAHVYRNRLLATRILRYARHPRLPDDDSAGKLLASPAVFKIRGTYPDTDDSSNTRIHHNTCFSLGDVVAGGRRDLSRDIQLHNNIFQSGAPCDGTRLVSHSGLAADGIVLDGNLYHRLIPCDLILNWNFVSTQGSTDRDYPDLASARASAEGRDAGWESRGVDSLDPGFRDPANHDLGLAPGSPALDAGASLPYASPDSTRIERLPDIGAIESLDGDPGRFFRRGDSNGDGAIDLSDGISLALQLYAGGEASTCLDAADANDDGDLDVSDVITILDFLFRGRLAPAFPGPAYCGPDPTGSDALTCAGYESAGCRLPLPEAPAK